MGDYPGTGRELGSRPFMRAVMRALPIQFA